MESNAAVSIIVISWNAVDVSRRLCVSLRATRYRDYEVVWVDNGSSDGTCEMLREDAGILPLRLIANRTNFGYAAAVNQAIKSVDAGRDVVLLNNDVMIDDPDWITKLRTTAYAEPDIGLVGCRLVQDDGRLQHIGTYMPTSTWRGMQIGGDEIEINQGGSTDDGVEGIVFACVYIPQRTIQKIGMLDEEFFAYYEDTDFCFRALQAGLRIVCCASLTMVHSEHTSTRVNGLDLSSIYEQSRSVFILKWRDYLENHRYKRSVGWISTLKLPSGYAMASQGLVKALEHRKVRVGYHYAYGPGTPFEPNEPPSSGDFTVDDIASRPLPQGRHPHVTFAQGDVFHNNAGPYRIGYTMLEVDGVPRTWVDGANAMDEVWVPSSFNVATFQAAGVQSPIHVIPLGYDSRYFHPLIKPVARNFKEFTFLSVFEWGERKAPELLLKAFSDEFGVGEEVVLCCHVSNCDPSVDIRNQVRDLRLRQGGGRFVIAINQRIPYYQVGALLRSFDSFVLATRGEGWGMPILEAMACGLPVIATDWSAPRDFFDEQVGYPVEVERLIDAKARCSYYDGFKWAEPSYEVLRMQMRRVFTDRQAAQVVGQSAADRVLTRFTFDHAAAKIEARLAALD